MDKKRGIDMGLVEETWIKDKLANIVIKDYPNYNFRFEQVGTNIVEKDRVVFRRIAKVDDNGELIGHVESNIEVDVFAKELEGIDLTKTQEEIIAELKTKGVISDEQL